ncbi:LOW QUALITY PROTEIN: protein ABHD18-like [Branchiostoma floridae x Branchiostoma japonicum]
MSRSKLDVMYRRLLLTKFFTRGWGDLDQLKRLLEFKKFVQNRDLCCQLVDTHFRNYPVAIDKSSVGGDCKILEGHFTSPLTHILPGLLPREAETARFQLILPVRWPTEQRPVCIHLAGTGDHFFWRRRTLMAKPLLKESGIASLLLENPYYGYRKPKDQLRSSLLNVSDIFVMGGALILESQVLLHWCERQGLGPLGLTGISMGGHMASLAASNWPKPIALVPCLSWSTASSVFTQGVLSRAIPWRLLEKQYENDAYIQEVGALLKSIGEDSFKLGQDFVTNVGELQHLNTNLLVLKSDSLDQVSTSKIVVSNPTMDKSEILQHGSETSLSGSTRQLLHDKDESRKVKTALRKARLKAQQRSQEAMVFMEGVMDEITHLKNYTVPVDPKLVVVVAAKHDSYVPRDNVTDLADLWPGCEVRYIDTGHIAAFLFNQSVFRKAITDAFTRMGKT